MIDHAIAKQRRETSLGLVFCAMSAVVVLAALGLYATGLMTIRANQAVIHTQGVIDDLETALATLVDAETGVRGFMLTADPQYLSPYNDATKRIGASMTALKSRADAGDISQADYAVIHDLADARLERFEISIAQRREMKPGDPLPATGVGKRIMDALRERVGKVGGGLKTQLAAERSAAENAMLLRTVIYCTMITSVLAFMAWAYRRLASENSRRTQAEADLQISEQSVRTQLAEIETIYNFAPIGLCFVDTNLRYVRINAYQAKINGLTAEQHIGRTPSQLFPGIADKAESVLRHVIQSGEPVLGLEITGSLPGDPESKRTWINHWLPLKDEQGMVIGVNIVSEDITERKRAEAELKTANAILFRRVSGISEPRKADKAVN